MKLTKEVVLSALSNITLPNEGKDIVESGAIKNIQIFLIQIILWQMFLEQLFQLLNSPELLR